MIYNANCNVISWQTQKFKLYYFVNKVLERKSKKRTCITVLKFLYTMQ